MSILKYKIERIKTNEFTLGEECELNNLNFSLSFQFKVNIDERLVACISRYEYLANDVKVMYLDLECYFKIEKENFKSLIKGDILTINKDFLQYMATIAIGVARGEIHARCELAGSSLQEIVIPPINLTKIITTPAEFDLD